MTVQSVLLVAAGMAALAGGAEVLVRGASRLALSFGIPPLVVGLTIVAFGTSAPELAAAVAAALGGHGDLVVGTVLGSNIANVLFILGLSALAAPLAAPRSLRRFDLPLMVGVSLAVWLALREGALGPVESGLMAAGLVAYVVWSVRRGRRQGPPVALRVEAPARRARPWLDAALVAVGLVLLSGGARALVQGAVAIARGFGVSEAVIALTLVAIGTSLPELATSVAATLRGEREIAVGNVVGSNIFNLLGVLGVSGLVAGHAFVVAPRLAAVDAPIMVATAVVASIMLAVGGRVSRREGALLVAGGLVYMFVLAYGGA